MPWLMTTLGLHIGIVLKKAAVAVKRASRQAGAAGIAGATGAGAMLGNELAPGIGSLLGGLWGLVVGVLGDHFAGASQGQEWNSVLNLNANEGRIYAHELYYLYQRFLIFQELQTYLLKEHG